MFNKTADPTSAPPKPVSGSSTNKSVLAADLKIVGEVSSGGSIEILGEVDGNIIAHGVIIGGEGRFSGTVRAETVEVRGKLDGKITTEGLTLRASAHVAADVSYSTVIIESGATIEGNFTQKKTS
jgi:cytoskeletal protein CcmA (bactofilin family)